MRNTYLMRGRVRAGRATASAGIVASSASTPAPIGGWDAISPLAAMPPQNAIELVNWFPQPGYVEVRRGHVYYCDTGTSVPVESLMAFQGSQTSADTLIAASDGDLYNVTSSTPTLIDTGFGSNRWQSVNFETSGGSFLWMCNGEDDPEYWDGTTLTTTVITGSGFVPADIIHCATYRNRIWGVLKESTKAVYLPLDSLQGAATVFDVGAHFQEGGYLMAIGTWSTDTTDGPNELIAFVSSRGDVAIYLITDVTQASGISFRGTANIGPPIGRRCLCKLGSDLGIITIDGVLPLSQVVTYDRAALLAKSITKNIRQAMTQAARDYGMNFGWQLISYPRNTMAILNVPISENAVQDQFVMNTITGAWAKFQGQNGSSWVTFLDRAYFGGNDGIVRLADESTGDEDQTLYFDMRCAFNYYGERGREKRWTMVRPTITIDATYTVNPQMGLNTDFQEDAALDPILFGSGQTLAQWNSSLWNVAQWPGILTESNWASVSGMGYCASIRIYGEIPWSEDQRSAKVCQINSFDVLYDVGAFI